jgi:hypothetical protein
MIAMTLSLIETEGGTWELFESDEKMSNIEMIILILEF